MEFNLVCDLSLSSRTPINVTSSQGINKNDKMYTIIQTNLKQQKKTT